MSGLILKVNGVDYGGWTESRVTRSIEQIAGSFELTVTDRWAGQSIARPIKEDDLCQVLINGEQIIAGAVDDRVVSYDKQSHSISINGRDATGDLVDCSVQTVQIEGNDLLKIAKQVCKPFDISVRADTDVGKVFQKIDAEPSQPVFDLLATLAAHRGVLLVSDTLGNLLITKASTDKSPGRIVYGENVLSCNANASMRDRYSEYTATHQPPQSDLNSGKTATQAKVTSTDEGVKNRYRPLTIIAADSVDLQKKADFERNVRAGRARGITYTVNGWHADGFTLWKPNTLVSVTDPLQEPKLDNTELLITSVTYIDGEQGKLTELTVMPRGAFDLLAVPEESGEAGW